jgi:uncharacterized protein (DUF885 family)
MLKAFGIALAAVVLQLAPASARAQAAPAGQAAVPARSAAIRLLLDEHLDWSMREDPVAASLRGDERFNDQLPDYSPEAIARGVEAVRDRLKRLEAIDPKSLSEEDRIDWGLLRRVLSIHLAGAAFVPEQMPLSNQEGPQVTWPQLPDRLRFPDDRRLSDYATRLEGLPKLLDQHIAAMRLGMAAGRVPPKIAVIATADQAASLADDAVKADPTKSPFYKPFIGRAASDPLAARARRAVAEGVIPAYAKLAAFLRDEYIPKARESTAARDGVDGLPFYEYSLRRETTTNLTAQQIHDIGNREVERIRGEMFAVIDRTDWPGRKAHPAGSDELFAAFFQFLRTEPRFYHRSAEDLLAGYRVIAKRVDPELPRLFGHLPRSTYGVRPLPTFAAKNAPTAFYYPGSFRAGLPGYFMANTYALDQRPKYEMVSLTLHEAVPGHHFERSITDELEGQHPFRSLLGFTSFVEGWALYAERLGLEMDGAPIRREADGSGGGTGLFVDPYDDFGRLTYEQWRAVRLVVDTGLHALGWSRQRAIDFMLKHTALSPLNIEREVDRYIAWPAQATAYKLGELKIRELRARGERALGEAFDLRAFHDTVLSAGPLPLDMLEERIDRWIAAQKR